MLEYVIGIFKLKKTFFVKIYIGLVLVSKFDVFIIPFNSLHKIHHTPYFGYEAKIDFYDFHAIDLRTIYYDIDKLKLLMA